jgi:hypothetical protein
MSHVDVHHRVYLGAGHHRQPRNPQPWVEPYGASAYDAVLGTTISEVAFPTISFTQPPSATVLTASFAFWSASAASTGTTQTSLNFSQTATQENLTLIAWYFLPAGGGGGGGGTEELLDAYSVALGTFVNDDFVTVSSDPSLTPNANIIGEVPTAVAETIDAFGGLASTSESFIEWVSMAGDGTTASAERLNVPAGANGFAFATYGRHTFNIPKPTGNESEGVIILDGIINDAPGHILVDGHPVPVDPGWGSLIKQMFTLAGLHADAGRLAKDGAVRVRTSISHELGSVAKHIGDIAQRGIGMKE